MRKDFTELINNYVQVIKINEDRNRILFESRDTSFVFGTYGDCCASLEFEDIEYPAKKPDHGWRIYEVEEEEEYGYRLKTYEGDIVISCRRTGGDWPGYETGVSLCYYKSNVWLEIEPKWIEFKEMK